MTEKMKEVYDSILNDYTKIGVLQQIIHDKKINLIYETDLEYRLELEIIIEILEKDVQTYKICKEKDEKKFSKLFLDYYKTACEFKDDYIIFDCENMDIQENYYRDILKEYWDLLRTQGFDNEDEFIQIIQNYNEICASSDFLSSFTNTGNLFSQKLGTYNELRWKYMKFIDALNDSATRILDPDTIQYILDNTSLIHLAYTNNEHKIVGCSSNNRLFLCQFHCEHTPSMRVSITKNFFNCFGCGNCGNQIDYIKDCENVSYDQAAYLLAEVYLIDIPDNPYKETENSLLVKKYRDVLISDKYRSFLINEYNKMNKSVDLDRVYEKMFSQIDRIKTGKYDDNFSYHSKSKKYKYYIPKNK